MKLEITVFYAVLVKELLIWYRYPARMAFHVLFPFVGILTLYFQGSALVGGRESLAFQEFAGTSDYLTFMVIGSVMYVYVVRAMWGFGEHIRREQWMGTVESIWVSPASKISVFMGIALTEGVMGTYIALVQMCLAQLILGVEVFTMKLFTAGFVVILLIFALYGLGFIFTGLIMIFKEISGLMMLINDTIRMVAPVAYPISVLPPPMRFLAALIPLTYALTAVRGFIIYDSGFFKLIDSITVLVVMNIIFFSSGIFVFYRLEFTARRRGVLGTH